MGDFSSDIIYLIKDFALMGRKFSRLARNASKEGDKNINRQFSKAVKEYQNFFGELKKLYKLL